MYLDCTPPWAPRVGHSSLGILSYPCGCGCGETITARVPRFLHGHNARRDFSQRFWIKVDKNGPIPPYRPDLGPCWLWLGTKSKAGYGGFGINGHNAMAHRVAYELVVSPIPLGMQLDHLCRVRACCNPGHLEPVTIRENLRRGAGFTATNARKAHCPTGHPYTPENTYRPPGTTNRKCRTCIQAHSLARAKSH